MATTTGTRRRTGGPIRYALLVTVVLVAGLGAYAAAPAQASTPARGPRPHARPLHRTAPVHHLRTASSYPSLPGSPPPACTGSYSYAYWPQVNESAGPDPTAPPCYLSHPVYGPQVTMTGPGGQTVYPGTTMTLGIGNNPQNVQAAWLLYWYQLYDSEPLMRNQNDQPANDTSGYDTAWAIAPVLDASACHQNSTDYNGGRYVSTCPVKVIKGPYYGTPAGQQLPWTLFTASIFDGFESSPIVTNSSGVLWQYTPNYFELPVFLEPSPYASFTSAQSASSMQFTDTTRSDLPETAWSWNFGDGTTSTAQNPLHPYAKIGTYTVSLTVTTSDGQTDTFSQSVSVINENPTLSGTVTDLSGHGVPTTLTLTNTDKNTVQTVATATDGTYSVTVPTGNYTLTPDPTLPVGTITPATQSWDLQADTTANLTFHGHRLIADVSDGQGNNIPGVPVAFTGSGTIVGTSSPTDTTGAAWAEVTDGSFTVTPSDPTPLNQDTFTPPTATVTVAGADNSQAFVFNAGPIVRLVAPNAGPVAGGTTVTLTGSGFNDADAPVTGVSFNVPGGLSLAAKSYTVNGANSMTVVTPNALKALAKNTTSVVADVVVTTTARSSITGPSDQFTFGNVPVVTAVSPPDGVFFGGVKVTVTGSHLTGATAVVFQIGTSTVKPKSFTVASDTQITLVTPKLPKGLAAPQTADLVVTTPDGSSPVSAGDQFKFRQPNIVQLGDSIASGEGINYNWGYNAATGLWHDTNPVPVWDGTYQVCHNSNLSYGNDVFATLHGASFTTFACTGATYLGGVAGPQSRGGQTIPAQFSGNAGYDTADPELVLVSIGADDIEFGTVVENCVKNAWSHAAGLLSSPPVNIPLECTSTNPGTTFYNDYTVNLKAVGTHIGQLAADISTRGKNSTSGVTPKVVFNDYFNPFPPGTTTCPDTGGLYSSQVTFLTAAEKSLNSQITGAVKAASKTYPNVGLAELKNAFTGNAWCSGNPYVFGISIAFTDIINNGTNINPSPFHPTPEGQAAIAAIVDKEAKKLLAQ